MLKKLQATKSNYSNKEWKKEDKERRKIQKMIQGNGDRFCQNPYFLHSVCTAEDSYYITLCKPAACHFPEGEGRKASAKGSRTGTAQTKKRVGQMNSDRPFSAPGVGRRGKKKNVLAAY